MKADTTITTESEVWKPVVGYEGIYEVSSEGRIRSLHRQVRHGASGASRVCVGIRTMSPANKRGYSVVSLSKNNKATTLTVHRIVATAFLERRQGDGPFEVNHKNGIKSDNRVGNLEWCTRSENQRHKKTIYPDMNRGEKSPNATFTDADIRAIRADRAGGMMVKDIAKKYGRSFGTIDNIVYHKTWSHVRPLAALRAEFGGGA